jgi:hypothetical protein
LLRPFPLWPIMIWLLWPLLILSNKLFSIAGYDTDFITGGLSWLVLTIYFYTLSCLLSFVGGKLIRFAHLLIGEKL